MTSQHLYRSPLVSTCLTPCSRTPDRQRHTARRHSPARSADSSDLSVSSSSFSSLALSKRRATMSRLKPDTLKCNPHKNLLNVLKGLTPKPLFPPKLLVTITNLRKNVARAMPPINATKGTSIISQKYLGLEEMNKMICVLIV